MTVLIAASSNPLDWLLSQPQLLVVVFAGAVWLMNMIARARRASSGADDAPERGRGQGPVPSAGDVDVDERARRVRAEILRKIAERRGIAPTAQPARARIERWAPAPPEIAPEAAPRAAGVPATVPGVPPLPAPQAPRAGPAPALGGAPGATPGAVWLDELRGRDSVRRAILVREILGPPIALR